MAKFKAVAQCRVSTLDQEINGNSLEAQEKYIYECAEYLDAKIVRMWSLNVSSRKGKNLARADLKEIYQYCKESGDIKYYILDEVDRFMRSVEEYYWWKVEFKKIGVFLAYAKLPDLTHQDDPIAVMREMLEVFRAEASNHERITKTTDKMKARVMAGYYPFYPHQGYQKTIAADGLHIPHEPYFSQLQRALKSIANFEMTPKEAHRWLLDVGYRTPKGGKELDMARFEDIATDIYYAGLLRVEDWPEAKGKHQAMISPQEHEVIVKAFSGRSKRRKKQFNPNLPLNKLILHEECKEVKNGKFTGFLHSNGKGWMRYEYSCRECNKGIPRDTVHQGINLVLEAIRISPGSMNRFKVALKRAWKNEEKNRVDRLARLNRELDGLNEQKSKYVAAIVNDSALADDIKPELEKVKARIAAKEVEVQEASNVNKEFQEFTLFALDYVENLRENFWSLDSVHLPECLDLLFPQQITVDSDAKVHIPKISPIFTLATTKKAPELASDAHMVELAGTAPASDW